MGHFTASFAKAAKWMMPDFSRYTRMSIPAASRSPVKMM
jgi:hypothetical protein